MTVTAWRRRARPQLGTLVELGVAATPGADAAIEAAFGAIDAVERALSAFRADSELSRFHSLAQGAHLRIGPAFATVLRAARAVGMASDGLFDLTLHRAPHGWRLDGNVLTKLEDPVRLELAGIAKGHAVDQAVQALRAAGIAHGWVNAGGDLRAFGDTVLPIELRDEVGGGVHRFGHIADGAFASSRFGADGRSRAIGPQGSATGHVSVAAPLCLWADALTKVVALSRDPRHPALAPFEARAWLH